MSRTAARGDEATGAGKGALTAILVVGTALTLLLIVRARPGPEPFDPRSSRGDGATALVELLERSGADVSISRTPPEPRSDARLLVLADRLSDEQRVATDRFVVAGGVLVVADPASGLHDGSTRVARTVEGIRLPDARLPVSVEANVASGRCSIAALTGLRGVYLPGGDLYTVDDDDARCFGSGSESFVIVDRRGEGTVIALGDNEVFVNRHLRRADNAGLAAALLAPEPGTDVVVLLGTGAAASVADVGSGEDTLFDLVPGWFWMALSLGALAFVVFAISRSVRVGRVLDEPLASSIAGSELVAATGNLMQRANHATRAGWLLQVQLHRELAAEYHVDPAAPLDELDRTVSARAGTAAGTVEALLRHQVADDAQLLALSARIDHLRRDVLE